MVRKWSEATDRLANKLVAVPAAGGGGFPGGVLVFAENFVIYQNRGHREVRTPIPRRVDTPESRGVLLVAAATHRQKDLFFVLAQSEYVFAWLLSPFVLCFTARVPVSYE